MKNRTSILLDLAKTRLLLEYITPKKPAKALLFLVVLLLCSLAVQAQTGLPSVPVPPSPWEYAIFGGGNYTDVTPLVHNICWANAAYPPGQHFPGYNVFSIGWVDQGLSEARCSQVAMPYPPSPAGPPYYFSNAGDCKGQQDSFFSGDPDAYALVLNYARLVVLRHPELCTAEYKANPTYSGPFMIPYAYLAPYPIYPNTPTN